MTKERITPDKMENLSSSRLPGSLFWINYDLLLFFSICYSSSSFQGDSQSEFLFDIEILRISVDSPWTQAVVVTG